MVVITLSSSPTYTSPVVCKLPVKFTVTPPRISMAVAPVGATVRVLPLLKLRLSVPPATNWAVPVLLGNSELITSELMFWGFTVLMVKVGDPPVAIVICVVEAVDVKPGKMTTKLVGPGAVPVPVAEVQFAPLSKVLSGPVLVQERP